MALSMTIIIILYIGYSLPYSSLNSAVSVILLKV